MFAIGPTGSLVLTNGFGDFNTDGKLDVLDLVLLNDHLSGAHALPAALTTRADLDQDSRVTTADARILEQFILQRQLRPDEDVDHDELTNAEELRLATNPLHPDTDRDGWPDGYEVATNADPLDAKSVPQLTVVAAPPVEILHPLGEEPAVSSPGVVIAKPPVELSLPSAAGDEQPGTIVAYPPAEVLVPAAAEGETSGAGIVAYPLVEIASPLGEPTDTNLTAGGVVAAVPGVEILSPLSEGPLWSPALGPILARPPLEINGPP